MAITRSKKETIIEKLRSIISDAQTIVFVHFDKVTVEEVDTLRSSCADEQVGYLVAKKTLIRQAFADAGIDGEMPVLDGEVALAYSDDQLAPARILGEQSKKLGDRLSIIGGVFDNVFVGQEYMQAIADIPPLKTLYAQFLTVIRSPVQGFASALGQIAEKK